MSQYIGVGALALRPPTVTMTDKITTALKAAASTVLPSQPTTLAPQPEPSFLSKYGIYLLGAAAVGGFIWWRRRRAGGRK